VIRDGNGCDATVAYEVYPQLVSRAVTKPLIVPHPDAVITLTNTGGNPAQFQVIIRIKYL
jgi:hypothetical protein